MSQRNERAEARGSLDGSGHLDALAVALACEGEIASLDVAARAHLEGCDDCAARLADEALASATVRSGLESIAAETATVGAAVEPVVAPAPTVAERPRAPRGLVVGAALVLFAMSAPALPGLLRGLAGLPGYGRVALLALVSALRTASIFVSRQDVALGCAAVFVVVGAAVAFAASRGQEKKDHALV